MNSIAASVSESLIIAGPSGNLEARLEMPQGQVASVAVICHPHPLHGGAMTNKVVHMLAKAFNESGAAAVRFNFRGVGGSAGQYDEGRGETSDAFAILDWAAQRWPHAALLLAGFSFGGAVAIRAAAQRKVRGLVTVAPAIHRIEMEPYRLPSCPWLLIQGDSDELVDAAEIVSWAQTLEFPPQLAVLPGVDHFFHGRLNDLREVVVKWLQATPMEAIGNS